MKNKIIGLFVKNIGLKLLAVIFAVILWLIVVNVDNPAQSKSFTVTVQVTNEDVLIEQGKYYTIPDNANTVTFRVTARRSIMEQLTASDFVAIADMNNLENDSRIPVEITASRYSGSVTISGATKYLTVEVGDRMTSKFIISGVGVGDPAEGYTLDYVEVSPNVITISGPAEEVSEISSVVAYCDVSGMSTEIIESVVPKVLDGNGKEMDTTNLELSETTVKVSAGFLSVKTVPIELESDSDLAEDAELESISFSPSEIEIVGDSSVLNSISSIVIPTSVVDLSKISSDFSTEVDVSSYLPEGATVRSGSSAKVKVSISVAEHDTVTYKVPAANITISSLASGLTAVVSDETVSIDVTGDAEKLENLKASQITGAVDASQITGAGTYTLVVVFDLDDEYTVTEATVTVTVTSNTSTTNDTVTTEGNSE
ncbi:MAG: hypothetical protein K6F30_04065 [Lachnospiraceae bacterium]|nr:hypothetical protein [Lachnospiraceae bacterium]